MNIFGKIQSIKSNLTLWFDSANIRYLIHFNYLYISLKKTIIELNYETNDLRTTDWRNR